MYAYIGRQAIYNKDLVVAGYELLYRSGRGGNAAYMADEDAATRGVLNDALSVFGLEQLTEGLPVFINFTRTLLLEDFAYLADPKEIVIEVPGEVTVDEALVNKFAELRRAGYRLALDGYSEFNGVIRFNDIIDMFDVIRVNMGESGRLQVSTLLRRLRRSQAEFLAERVETEEDFDIALSLDFSLFQGYFFEKPNTLSKRIHSLAESVYGRLFNELLRSGVDFERCARILRRDLVLTYMFLRQFQTGGAYHGDELAEIQRGMLLMGTEELRRWVCLVMLKQYNTNPSDETARQAYTRGLFIERLMEHSDTSLEPKEGFLMGVFSLLPQVTDLQMGNLLKDIALEPELKAALLGGSDSEYSEFLTYVVLYEMANPRLILPDIQLRISEDAVAALHKQCAADADAAFTPDSAPVVLYRGNLVR